MASKISEIMNGKIIKGIAGFYYVHTGNAGVYECKAKGIFRNQKIKPHVGDDVELSVIDEEEKKANIVSILPRKNCLIRPAVANVEQALVVFATTKPAPNLNLLDKLIVSMLRQKVECIICFNKQDIATKAQKKALEEIYGNSKITLIPLSTVDSTGIDKVRSLLKGKTTVLAGPSGVGKSSLVNIIYPQSNMETGNLSEKIDRGKHTTRHSELFMIEEDTFICDTPGFTSLYLDDMMELELKDYYPEFYDYEGLCKFNECVHVNEPKCAVKEAVENGNINRERYDNYVKLYEELKQNKKY